ncbi:MAG: hypothetical protein Q4F13_00895 [Pseudomonadota bacterium]|nr:hypothetical protein [Pseudomonadota bacterium]
MNRESLAGAPTMPDLPSGSFAGRERFRDAVRQALQAAAVRGWRELVLSDASFADWPLGERQVTESLQAWVLGPGQRLTMLARQYDDVVRQHARFVTWRRQWSHKIECRVCPWADPLDIPSALWAPEWSLQRLDVLRHTGVYGSEPEQRVLLRQRINEWLGRSSTGFAATTLGL